MKIKTTRPTSIKVLTGLLLIFGIASGFLIPNIQQGVDAQINQPYNMTTSQMTNPMAETMDMKSNNMQMMSGMMDMGSMSNNTTGMDTMSSMHGQNANMTMTG